MAQSLINISYKNHLLTKPVRCLLIFENVSSHVMKPTWREKKQQKNTVSDIKEDPSDKTLQILDNLNFFMTKQVKFVSQVVKRHIVRPSKNFMNLIIMILPLK